MMFAEELTVLLERKERSLPELAHLIGVSPGTPRFWAKGRSGPGKKRLETLLSALGCDEDTCLRMRELRDSHTPPQLSSPKGHQDAKRLKDKFSQLFSEALANRSTSLYELADLAGVTRASMYGWLQGKAIPSPKKLDHLLSALDCSPQTRDDLSTLCDEARKANPRPIGYRKRTLWERQVVHRILNDMNPEKMDGKKADSSFFDLLIFPAELYRNKPNSIPLLSRRASTGIDSMFTHACEAMRITGSGTAIIVVPEVKSHAHEELFVHHGIRLMTEADFGEMKDFSWAELAKG